MNRIIALYMDDCHSRQLRPKTMQSYEQALRLFSTWLEETHCITQVEAVKDIHIRSYINDLQTRGKYTFCCDRQSEAYNHPTHRRDYQDKISNITINNYLRNLRAFFTWLVGVEYIDRSPMKKIRLLPDERNAREYLEDDEVIRLLKSLDKSVYPEYRDYVLIMLMLDSGTRIGETLSAENTQLDLHDRSLHLPADKTKGRKARTVFFSSKTARELRYWLQYRDRYCDSDYLFPVKNSGFTLQVSDFEKNFTKYCRRAGIKKRVSPHTLRNNFAKRCLLSGMDIYSLSRILGHSSVEVTEQAYPSIDKPWMKNWPAFLLEGRKTYERIIDNVRAVWSDPDEVIINYYDTHITVKEFFDRVDAIAKSLHAMGVKEGDSVAVSLESVPEFMELFLACEILGCSVKNFLETGMDKVELINTCSADVYFTHDYIADTDVELVYSQTHINRIVMIDPLYSSVNVDGIRPHIRAAIEKRYCGQPKSVHSKNMLWHEFLRQGELIERLPEVQKGNIVLSAFTSGSTGKRKEVLHTSESLLGVIRQIALIQSAKGERPSWLLAIAPPTLVACVGAFMWQPLASGKYLILDPFCKLEDLDLEIMHFRPNAWSISPIFFEPLLDSNRIPDDYDMSHLVQFGVGAEPLTIKMAKKIENFFNKHNCKAAVCNSYGLSEAGSGCTIAIGNELVMTGTSGIPYLETVMAIFEPGTSKELKYGEIGEICKAGPGLMKGYADAELTAKTLKVHPDGQIWLHTGDFGFMTEQGLLFTLGRNAIPVYPDKHVFSLRIEEKILRHDAIRDAIIISGADADHAGFEKLYLFVVLEKGCSQEQVMPELQKHIEAVLLPEERPAQIFVLDKKPIHGFKTDRKLLKERYNL